MSEQTFSHEKLEVYQKSLAFVGYVDDLLQDLPDSAYAVDQLDRASSSIPLNIAEGNGKYSEQDRCSYFDNARGSAFECASCLDLLVRKDLVDKNDIKKGKRLLREIVSMLVGLIKSDSDRVHEDQNEYDV